MEDSLGFNSIDHLSQTNKTIGSRQSSCSIRSTSESLNDFLDLYANDDSEIDAYQQSIASLHEEIGIPSNVENSSLSDSQLNKSHDKNSLELSQANHFKNKSNSGIHSKSPFKAPNHNTSTEISHQDSTIVSIIDTTIIENNNDNIQNKNMNISNNLNTYTYSFDNSDDGGNLGIDDSILQMINNLEIDLGPNEELDIELNTDNVNRLHPTSSHKNNRLSNDFDFLDIEMFSEDDDYDHPDRFNHFFELNDMTSNNELNIGSNNIEHTEEHSEEDEANQEVYNELVLENTDMPSIISQITDNFLSQENIQTLNISSSPCISRIDSIPFSDEPPPYSEFDIIAHQKEQLKKDEEFAFKLQNEEYHDNVDLLSIKESESIFPNTNISSGRTDRSISHSTGAQSVISTNSLNSFNKRISIKVKKNKDGELSRHASVDYYQMERYLPPYRSLINPNKVFDYRTNTYIDANDNDIEIKAGTGNKHIVAIHKKKRDSRLMSIILTTNNNIKQTLKDVTNDALSIKSRSVSLRSITSIQNSNHSDHIVKNSPTVTFKDLPEEIHQLIVNNIDNQRDLVNCLYVSKSFHSFALPNIYMYPKFTSTYRLGQFVHTILNNQVYAAYVKIFDLSKITFPVILNKREIAKYQDKLIYGSSSAIELLNGGTRPVYAGWRDWKFRNHPLYGNFSNWRRRTNSSSTISSGSTLAVHWDTSINKNLSTSNLSDHKKIKSGSNVTLINTRTRSHSGSETILKGGALLHSRARSNSTSGTLNNTNGKGNKSRNNNTSRNKQMENGIFVKSFKKAFGLEMEPVKSKKKGSESTKKSDFRKTASDGSSTKSSTKRHIVKESAVNIELLDETFKRKSASNNAVSFEECEAFSTPHPMMNALLKQYCFNRDIPVGYIIHVLEECHSLEELNFTDVVLYPDYELKDYKSFDWYTGKGQKICNGRPPFVIDEKRAIYWSDTDRDMDITDEMFIGNYTDTVEFKNIWKLVFNLENIRRLKLVNISSLEQSIIEGFVMKSKFKNKLQYLDCSSSGMVKREEWDQLKSGREWREYFRSSQS